MVSHTIDNEDRVRRHTAEHVNRRIDERTEQRVREQAGSHRQAITEQIEQLEREWDIERWLEANASTLALTGLVLGLTRDRRWLALPGVVLPFLLLHALHGWCPPLPLLRRAGVRTRQEIDRERYALKALRGDFTGTPAGDPEVALAAARG